VGAPNEDDVGHAFIPGGEVLPIGAPQHLRCTGIGIHGFTITLVSLQGAVAAGRLDGSCQFRSCIIKGFRIVGVVSFLNQW
jgi:hypothetical protein